MSEFKLVPDELLQRLISATKVARGEGSPTQRDAEAILNAPQPPALGGEPEVLGYRIESPEGPDFAHADTQLNLAYIASLPGWEVKTLIDRAHVAPLLADNSALRDRISKRPIDLTNMRAERDTLKAELTKARELIQESDDFLYMLTAYDHEVRFLHQHGKSSDEVAEGLRNKLCSALATQSTPAAKDGAQ